MIWTMGDTNQSAVATKQQTILIQCGGVLQRNVNVL